MSDLLERVRAATGADRRLDAEIACALTDKDCRPLGREGRIEHVSKAFIVYAEPYTGSLDAALALVERKLPGEDWAIGNVGGQCVAAISRARYEASAPTPALALLAALLVAVEGGA